MTSSVKMASAPTKAANGNGKTRPHANRPDANRKGRLRILAGALLLCAVALPVSWWILLRKPPPPPETAAPEIKRNYWRQRVKDDVSDVPAYVALGIAEERRGYSTAAVRYLLAARSLGAPDADISGPLGRALLALARDDEALPELEKAAKLRPDDLSAALNLAGFYVIQERPDAAMRLLQRFADAHPALSPDDLQRLAFAQMECGDDARAKATAEKALASDPKNPQALSVAARASLARNDFARTKDYTKTLLALSGGEASVRYLHGLALFGAGEPDAAVEEWRKVVAQNPAALDAHERLGEVFHQRGDNKDAALHFEIIARNAPNPFTVSRIAAIYTQLKEREKAAYWRAVQVGLAGDFPAALELGEIAAASKDPYVHRKGLEAMAEAYRGLRRQEPYLATIRRLATGDAAENALLFAGAYQQLDRHEERTRYLLEALKNAGADAQPRILYSLAGAYQGRGMRDEAEKALEEAIQRAPRQAAYRRELAKLYFERRALNGRLTKAIHEWGAALSLEPDEAADWQNIGVAYAEAGDAVRAAAALEHAVDLEPGSGPAYRELSRASAKLGDKESAARYNALYAKYVAFDQRRQTLRTRANRPGAIAADYLAYGDLLVKMTALTDAAPQYERALALNPQDAALRERLAALYSRLRQPEKRAAILAGGASALPQPVEHPMPPKEKP